LEGRPLCNAAWDLTRDNCSSKVGTGQLRCSAAATATRCDLHQAYHLLAEDDRPRPKAVRRPWSTREIRRLPFIINQEQADESASLLVWATASAIRRPVISVRISGLFRRPLTLKQHRVLPLRSPRRKTYARRSLLWLSQYFAKARRDTAVAVNGAVVSKDPRSVTGTCYVKVPTSGVTAASYSFSLALGQFLILSLV